MAHFLPISVLIVIVVARFLRSRGSRPAQTPAVTWTPVPFDAAAYGLAPRDVLDPQRPGPPAPDHVRQECQAIADAAFAGDWRPAAAYIAAAGQDWDENWSRLELLRSIAREDDAWLTTWRAEDPNNCDAATLEADRMVNRAWEVRGRGYANETPEENITQFRALLPAAIEAAQRAALLDPQNPGPWVVMVTAARGAQYKPERFWTLWVELVARAPHHYEGHWQGMQYWCAKWFGSNKQMLEFARRAMDNAPAGSPLAGIYLHALSELEARRSNPPSGYAAKKRLAAVATALAAVREDDDHLPALRHLLAYYLGRAGMHGAALEQFRLLGPWCGSSVWAKNGLNRADGFHHARAVTVAAAKAKPLTLALRAKNVDAAHLP
ncbi:hypothetical protein ACFW1A_33845 [Kitasatospora sp. NPDC058965]|uniref:hypothetical protein n=1 Tax=Kitasatospora sp. NPDC058965 TaxID=3346682 RepID=UPI003684C695